MKIDEVRRILTIGAGTMGHQIGFLCAVDGYDLVVYDVAPDIFEAAQKRLAQLADRFVKSSRLPAREKAAVLSRITFTSDAQLAANAAFLKMHIDDGRLGVKSGAGFYTYPAPLFRQPGFLKQTARKQKTVR